MTSSKSEMQLIELKKLHFSKKYLKLEKNKKKNENSLGLMVKEEKQNLTGGIILKPIVHYYPKKIRIFSPIY